jgi:ABC-type multidrug transport system ATPase subunit
MVGNDSATITTINQPLLPRSDEASARVSELSALLLLVLCFVLAASILSASYAVFIVRERESGSRALQTIAGVTSPVYWLANLTWDYIHFCIPAAGVLTIVSVLISMPQLRGPRGSALAVLFLSFGTASIPMTYAAQRMFSEISALQKLSSFYFSTGFLGFLTTWILDLVVTILQPPGADTVAHVLHIVLSWFSPHYCLAKGVFDIAQTYHQHQGYPNADVWAVVWPYVTYMLTQAVMYMVLTLVLDRIDVERVICWILQYIGYEGYGDDEEDVAEVDEDEDEDVRKEREAIQAQLLAVQNDDEDGDVEAEGATVNQGSPSSSSTATLQDISKRYGLIRAVKHVWLSLPSASIFGLLGTNGAGKSTTIRILTGEEYPDRGDAVVGGLSMVSKRAKARQHVAYCPQNTALPSALTGREVLSFYARLRGVPYGLLPFFVNRILQQFGLKPIGDRCVGQYSGGNQRRMAVAVALIAARELTVLDEPSTGLDPAARRALWKVLGGETRVRRAALMLTTHSMEEAEAICGRIAIMAGGKVKYIGTAQHLKNKLTAGYWLEVIVDHHRDGTGTDSGTSTIDDNDTDNIAKIKAAIEQCCDGWAKLKRQGALGALSYMVTIKNDNGDGVLLADVFEGLEKLGVEYTLSQVTLEHAFLMAM